MTALAQALGDGVTLTQRNLLKLRRNVTVVVWGVAVPILMALLFAYVLGSAIQVPGTEYREFLIVGVLLNAVLTSTTNTAVGIAEDMKKGLVDRFRSLPMAQSAVLVGRTTSDVLNTVVILTLMSLTGLLIGWRIRSSPLDALAGFGLLLLFTYACTWITAYLGVATNSPEVMANSLYLFLMPIVFISNAFVPTAGMPSVLRVIAEWNPVSAIVSACRQLFGNVLPGSGATSDAWPMQNPILASLLWIGLILVIFVPLATRRYQKAVGQ